VAGADINEVHPVLFKHVYGFLNPDAEKSDIDQRLTNLEYCANALDAFSQYVMHYCRWARKNKQIDLDTVSKFFLAIDSVLEDSKRFYEQDIETATTVDDYDDEQRETQTTEIEEQYIDVIVTGGLCLG